MIITGSFDPITKREKEYIVQCKKQYGSVKIVIRKSGILSYEARNKLVEMSLHAYRHIAVIEESNQYDVDLDVMFDEEQRVRQGDFYLCEKSIVRQLHENGYYYEDVIKARCNPHRASHSISVADVCRQIAHAHHLDEKLAYHMGLLHDITKNCDDAWNESIIARYEPSFLTMSPKVWHAFTATIYLKQNMGLYDTKLLNAIEHHTLGDGHSLYDMILYIADKIEPTRGYDTTYQMRLAKIDIPSAFLFVYNDAIAYRKKENNHE